MQIKETLDVSFPGAVESPPLEDVVVLADRAGVALGVQRTFSARVQSVRGDGSGLINRLKMGRGWPRQPQQPRPPRCDHL